MIGLCVCGFGASAQSADLHPDLGKKPPREVLNKDILALPQREQTAWIHGAMAQMAQILAAENPEAGKCVMGWYFEVGDGAEAIPLAIKTYPDYPATATVVSLARKACPDL